MQVALQGGQICLKNALHNMVMHKRVVYMILSQRWDDDSDDENDDDNDDDSDGNDDNDSCKMSFSPNADPWQSELQTLPEKSDED